jgi:hypothetical protein
MSGKQQSITRLYLVDWFSGDWIESTASSCSITIQTRTLLTALHSDKSFMFPNSHQSSKLLGMRFAMVLCHFTSEADTESGPFIWSMEREMRSLLVSCMMFKPHNNSSQCNGCEYTRKVQTDVRYIAKTIGYN